MTHILDHFIENRFLEVGGTPFERGLQQGRVFKKIWNPLFDSLVSVPLFPAKIQKVIPKMVYRLFLNAQGKKFLKLHRGLLQNHQGVNVYKKIEGLAKGLGKDVSRVYGINSFEALSSELPYTLGCASLGFSAENCDTNKPLMAYNHDFPDLFGQYLFVRKNIPVVGYTSLSLTYPTLVGAIAGINEAGLALTLNHAYTLDREDKPGLFFTILLQECLDRCKTVDEAIHLIDQTPVPNGSMISLMDAAGHKATYELSCTARKLRRAKSKILVTLNRYQMKEMEKVQIPLTAQGKWILKGHAIHAHNFSREKRLKEILNLNGVYSPKDILKILSDHNGGTGAFDTLCRHDQQTSGTLAHVLMDPSKKALKVIFGHPCSGKYVNYKL